jgi:hypothetical protein
MNAEVYHEGKRVIGVKCLRPYVGVVPYRSCVGCYYNLQAITAPENHPPLMHCGFNGKDGRAECVTS